MMQSRKEQLLEQRQAIALQREAMVQQRQAQEEQRRVQEEQRRVQEEQRKVQEKQRKIQEEQRRESRVSELVDRSRPATVVGGGSLAGIWPTAAAAAATGAASEVVAGSMETDANPFADPDEFNEQIQMVVSMGFPDNEELRSVMRDFGGEVEAVVEFLISSRQ